VVSVLHYRLRRAEPTIVVELPDGSARAVLVSWTDRAAPSLQGSWAAEGLRVSVPDLLEVAKQVADGSDD
jgi:hypothetical protein